MRIIFALSLLLWFCAAQAQMIGNRAVVILNPQVQPANASAGLPAVEDSLGFGGYPVAGGICSEYGHQVPCNNHYSVVRVQTVTSYCTANDGMLAAFPDANTFRMCNGVGDLIEEGRINNALWGRDMTNAAWVKVGMGTALNAVGAEGTANSATTLTATGTASSCVASCTILQTLVLGSTADTYSVYLKRVTGSGAINITINNLAGTTACTLTTTAFTRCTVTATLANPVVGIQMATLNDVIIADFNQLEAGAFVTSPIPTTTVAVSRGADTTSVIGKALSVFGSAQGALIITSNTFPTAATFAAYLATRNGTVDSFFRVASATTVTSRIANTTIPTATLGSGSYTTTVVKTGIGWDAGGESLVANGGTVATSASAFGAVGIAGTVLIGQSTAGQFPNTTLPRITGYLSRLPDSQVQALTQN